MTEPTNVERLLTAFAGWGEGNPAGIAELAADDCELVVPESVPYGGTWHGPDAVASWFAVELWRHFEEFNATPIDLIDGGDKVVVPMKVVAVARNGRRMEIDNLWLYEFRDGSLVRLQAYIDTAVAARTVAGS